MRVDTSHSFFFEHAVDHVPGLALIEAARQFGLAVAHRYYEVPMDYVFLLSGMNVGFTRLIELDQPAFIRGTLEPLKWRRGVVHELSFSGTFVQGDRDAGEMVGIWRIMPKSTWQRMRRRARG